MAGRLLYRHTRSWWALLFYTQITSLQVLSLAAVGLAHARGFSLVWLLPVALVYLLATGLPPISSRFSAALWRELTTPTTRLGRGCLALGLAALPVAGVVGGVWGLWARRLHMTDLVFLVGMGGLGTLAATLAGFSFSYQLWVWRPWAGATGADSP